MPTTIVYIHTSLYPCVEDHGSLLSSTKHIHNAHLHHKNISSKPHTLSIALAPLTGKQYAAASIPQHTRHRPFPYKLLYTRTRTRERRPAAAHTTLFPLAFRSATARAETNVAAAAARVSPQPTRE